MIYLSAGEAAKAKQITQDLKSAQDRDNRAATAWGSFCQTYQAAHPELPGLKFAPDFRLAFASKTSSSPYPLERQAVIFELPADERQKAESLHREMLEAKRSIDQAQKNWSDFWHTLVADHVPPNPAAGWTTVTLPSGASANIPNPWTSGVIFTPDFRVAVPR